MSEAGQTTLHLILSAAMQEFLEKGYKSASLRNIVKMAGVTTGAFYGYYGSKEDLFEALVGEHYNFFLDRFCRAQKEFAAIPPEEQPDNLSSTSGECMYEMLLYAYEHLNEFKLILCCSEGTRFSKLIDEMVEIETKGTHDYLAVLEKLGRPAPRCRWCSQRRLPARRCCCCCLRWPRRRCSRPERRQAWSAPAAGTGSFSCVVPSRWFRYFFALTETVRPYSTGGRVKSSTAGT